MKKRNRKNIVITLGLLASFLLWTAAVSSIDVQAIGPKGSAVGFAGLNSGFHSMTGVHMTLYTVTDWLGLVPVGIALGFAILGLAQLIRRKRFLRVDHSILALGGFYILVIAAYLFFEAYAVNYRPVLINGYLEASYPSSTTMLVLCVIPTAMMQLNSRLRNGPVKKRVLVILAAFAVFMVAGRLISGVHWLTDIVGSVPLSAGLVMLYHSVCSLFEPQESKM